MSAVSVNPLGRMSEAELDEMMRRMLDLEYADAREDFAVYCGLQVPAMVESDDEDLTDERVQELEQLADKERAERYVPASHHRKLCWALNGIERGHIIAEQRVKLDDQVYEVGDKIPFKRLMIFSPPGSAKSTYASVLFPAWYLGKHPKHNVIQGSYADQLARRFGRRARNTFASPVHHDVFGVSLGKDQQAAGSWETQHGGEYYAFGMNTGVTGRRANGVILDDIVKGRKEANSETVRESTWDTYTADVRTRMVPNSWVVYIGTRWHEDDPAGRILPKGWAGESGWVKAKDGEWWYVLSFVAIVETKEDERKDPLGRKVGDWLWPEWFPKSHFEQERATQGPYNWASLFKQRPQPLEGGIFKRKWFKLWPNDVRLPKLEYVVQSYDTAFTEKTQNDATTCVVGAIFKHPRTKVNCLLLCDTWRDHMEYPDLRKRVRLDYKAKYGEKDVESRPDAVLVEEKGSGIVLLQDLRLIGVPAFGYNPGKADKITRANAAAPFVAIGRVYLLESAKNPNEPVSWASEFLAELLGFPNAANDDFVDAFTQMIIFLRNKEMLDAKIPGAEDEKEQPVAEDEGYVNPYAQ